MCDPTGEHSSKAAASDHLLLYLGVAGMIPTARDIPPTQPSARQDALYPKRGPSNSLYFSLAEWPRLPSTARINDPSKLAPYSSREMAPVLVPLRPSSEHILIVRAPGARDRHGCHSTPFIVRVLRARREPGRSLLILLKPRVARARGTFKLPHPLFQHPARHLESAIQLELPPHWQGPG
jgi:hypothetical protein